MVSVDGTSPELSVGYIAEGGLCFFFLAPVCSVGFSGTSPELSVGDMDGGFAFLFPVVMSPYSLRPSSE